MIGKAKIKLDNYVEGNIMPFAIVYLMTGIILAILGKNK